LAYLIFTLQKIKTNPLRKYLLFFLLLTLHLAKAQQTPNPIGARYLGLGAYSNNFVDAFSALTNQAALAKIKNASAGVYGERRFALDALNQYTAVFVLPTSSGNFGLKADYFGSTAFNESQIGLAYGRSLGTKLDIGIKFNYNSYSVAGYGSAGAVNFELGAIAHLNEQFHAGVHVYNPMRAKLGKTDETLNSIYKFGLGYEASDKLFVSAEAVKEEDRPVSIHAGFQYNFVKQFFLRAGINSSTDNYYAGVSTQLKTFRIDVATSYHPQLGWTPGILLLFDFNKKDELPKTEL
jgi:hypothetical protein